MFLLDSLGIPPVCQVIKYHLDHLDVTVIQPRTTTIIQANMRHGFGLCSQGTRLPDLDAESRIQLPAISVLFQGAVGLFRLSSRSFFPREKLSLIPKFP